MFYWGTDNSAGSGTLWNFISSLSPFNLQIFTNLCNRQPDAHSIAINVVSM